MEEVPTEGWLPYRLLITSFSALPEDIMLSFGIGVVRYIRPNIDYMEAFHLNEYRSAPFLLKLHNHQDDRGGWV